MSLQILQGHWVEQLKKLPDNSVHMSCTSPPYFGLRRYCKPGSPGAEHELGNEKTPEEYIQKMVEGFREVRRVLREDGTCWVNLGDAYNSQPGQRKTTDKVGGKQATNAGSVSTGSRSVEGLKPKDLMMMPSRVAMALQADGWYLRSMIPWVKRNPMPESVKDRPVSAIEYVFLFSKSPHYFYDYEAVKLPSSPGTHARVSLATLQSQNGGSKQEDYKANTNVGKKSRDRTPNEILKSMGRKIGLKADGVKNNEQWKQAFSGLVPNRHLRNSDFFFATYQGLLHDDQEDPLALIVNPCGYAGAHFATYPEKLVRPMVLAGTSAAGCCSGCGSPFHRLVEDGAPDLEHQKACGGNANGEYNGQSTKDYDEAKAQDASATKARILAGMVEKKTIAWLPSCNCAKEPVPCTVLDPFGGSGTTAKVSIEEGRHVILCELNDEYIPLIRKRCDPVTPALLLA